MGNTLLSILIYPLIMMAILVFMWGLNAAE
jgi:hypothetical protein